MKSLYVLIAVTLLILVFYPKITMTEHQIYTPSPHTSDKLSSPRIYDFYIPQLTTPQQKLSFDKYNNQENANQLTRDIYLNDDTTNIIRREIRDTSGPSLKILHRDTLSGNTIDSNELHSAGLGEDLPYKPYSDENISQFPKFYTSDIQNEMTNVGKFFDKNIKYNDTTTSSSSAYLDDKCFVNSDNEITCMDNTRLQNLPIKSTEKDTSCSINTRDYKTSASVDSVMNGLSFYDSVFPGKQNNETYSAFTGGPIIRDCFGDSKS